jgi:hypothetical protein
MSLSMTKLAVGVKEYLLMAIGMFMYAFGWVACVIPAGGMGGGATGLSMIFYAIVPAISIGTFVFIIKVQKSALPADTDMSHSEYQIVEELLETIEQDASDSEAWANGTRDGVPVDSSDPAYHNNSKYWSQQSSSQTLDGLTDVSINSSTLATGNTIKWNGTSEEWENAYISTCAYDSNNTVADIIGNVESLLAAL